LSSALDRLKNLTAKISSYELARKENIVELDLLFNKLGINKKVSDLDALFLYKAINITGISLHADSLAQIQEGKYIQIIAISYDKERKIKNRNSSLGYFGRAEKIDESLKSDIVTFILRWRFEKSFMTLERYHTMIQRANS